MFEGIMVKLAIVLVGILSSFTFGFFKGKKSTEIKQLKINLKDAAKSKKRQISRRDDNISTVKCRMRKYLRK